MEGLEWEVWNGGLEWGGFLANLPGLRNGCFLLAVALIFNDFGESKL